MDEADEAVVLRMYVASDSVHSMQARRQLAGLRERFGGEDWEVEVVNVFEQPALAEADRVLATPQRSPAAYGYRTHHRVRTQVRECRRF